MTDGKWLSDAQLHRELLQCIARYQGRGIQVSDLLPTFRDILTRCAPQGVPSLFPSDPAHDVREQSLEALRTFTNKGWIALTDLGSRYAAEAYDPDALLTREHQGRVVATITGLGRTSVETGALSASHPSRAASPPSTKAPYTKGAETSGTASIAAMVRRKAQRSPPPKSDVAARHHIAASIAGRRGQQAFRQRLLHLYQQCLVTGCNAEDALEAAHIQAYSEAGTFALSNGLLLRADIHTLFDLGFLTIETSAMTVMIAPALMHTVYSAFHGQQLQFPPGTAHIPNRHALDTHRYAHACTDDARLW